MVTLYIHNPPVFRSGMAMSPAERIIEVSIPSNEYAVIDTAWCLSQINRRSYRQGYEYAIDKLELFQTDPTVAATLNIYRLPATWVSYNSWVKAYSHWKEQQDDAMAETGTFSMRAKYRDFKIVYNLGHATGLQGGVAVTQPVPAGSMSLADAQAIDVEAEFNWDYSQMVVPNVTGAGGVTQEYIVGLIGPDSGTYKGLIHAYADSRSRPFPEDPSTVTPTGSNLDGGLYAAMQDVGEDFDEVMENVTERNNSPPYLVAGIDSPSEFYPGGSIMGSDKGVWMDRLRVAASTSVNNPLSTDSTGSFTALCGLILVFNESESSNVVRLHCSPGDYHGVLARPMGDGN